jgi:DNA polymerase-3 subunit gamma/tau
VTTQALYNRWRGQAFDEILGQEHITRTLQNQIRASRIGHAYLFTGLRGTGKTSTARILAKAVNCIGETDNPPCNACPICRHITEGRSLDLIEIDAASNRGIDEIRDLRDRVAFVPQESRFKVYVIDEVHMLTNEAFNALLKTLEEPPSHVIFILCTTEPHRLPDTILSRCQRFDFRRGSVADVEAKLRHICEAEGLVIADQALQFIARRAGGSFRDGESLLDQLAAFGSGEITLDLVETLLGSAPIALVNDLVHSLVYGDVSLGLRAINQAIDEGAEPRQFLQEIIEHLRALLLLRVGGGENVHYLGGEVMSTLRDLARHEAFAVRTLVRAIRLFNDAGQGLRNAARPQLPLELALIDTLVQDEEASGGREPSAREAAAREPADRGIQPIASARIVAGSETAAAPEARQDEGGAVEQGSLVVVEIAGAFAPADEARPDVLRAVNSVAEPQPSNLAIEWVRGNWNAVVTRMKGMDRQVQALLRDVYPVSVQGDVVMLACKWPLHRDKLSQEDKRALVEQVLSAAVGVPCHIQCIVQADAAAEPTTSDGPARAGPKDLLSGVLPTEAQAEDARRSLLDHPVVKDLERRGGRVARVELYRKDEGGG